MRYFILFFFLLYTGSAIAQQPDNYSNNNYNNNQPRQYNRRIPARVTRDEPINNDYNQIRITDSTQEIHADVLPYQTDPKLKDDRYYFWCLSNVIHSTQGGYSGKLLNGHYVSFYPDKNLKEEGGFDRGLKQGVWKTWNSKGDLTGVVTWNEGIAVPDNEQPIWKKIPFFNKRDNLQRNPVPAVQN